MAYSAIMLFAKVKRPEPAAKKLGWEEIDCIFTDLSETDRELWEIDENLVRAELTTAEKREHLKRRKEVWERRQKEARDTGGKSLPTSLADGLFFVG